MLPHLTKKFWEYQNTFFVNNFIDGELIIFINYYYIIND
jgi:hypothetical protein